MLSIYTRFYVKSIHLSIHVKKIICNGETKATQRPTRKLCMWWLKIELRSFCPAWLTLYGLVFFYWFCDSWKRQADLQPSQIAQVAQHQENIHICSPSSLKSVEETPGDSPWHEKELGRAIEGYQPSSRTSICTFVWEQEKHQQEDTQNELQQATSLYVSDQTVRDRFDEGCMRDSHPLVVPTQSPTLCSTHFLDKTSPIFYLN